MDRLQQAKNVDIMSFLSSIGHKPTTIGQSKAWFNSPLASENKASFVVYVQQNTWSDFGRGKNGDVIDLVMEINGCDLPSALDIILDGKVNRPTYTPPKVPIKESGIAIIDVRYITNKYLLDYARSRAISEDVLRAHCYEVEFVFTNYDWVSHTAIGFKNEKGGWELRSATKKVGNSPKSWSMVRGTSGISACDVFEGFFDFLSHLEYHNLKEPELDSFILNSLVFCPWVKPSLNEYRVKNLYLDNNPPAKEFMAEHFTEEGYVDRSGIFVDVDDYNEFLKQQKQ